MSKDALERLLRTLEVRLDAFGVCEVERGWRLNSSPMEATTVHYVLKGEGALETEGVQTAIGAGTIIIAPSGARKTFVGPGAVLNQIPTREACVLRKDGLASFRACRDAPDLVVACAAVSATYGGGRGLFDGLSEPLVEAVPQSEPFRSAFESMLEECARPGPGGVVLIEALMKQCLVILLRSHLGRDSASPLLAHLLDERLSRAVALMVSAPAHDFTLDRLAAEAGMSRSAFATRFNAAYGSTPFEFLQSVRLRAAARLLESAEMPVKVVASTVGYASRSHFSRAFRAAYGVDPSGFRQRAGAAGRDSAPAR